MRQNGSRDFFVLARVALEGAIRSRADLVAILDEPAPTRAPRKVAPVEATLA